MIPSLFLRVYPEQQQLADEFRRVVEQMRAVQNGVVDFNEDAASLTPQQLSLLEGGA